MKFIELTQTTGHVLYITYVTFTVKTNNLDETILFAKDCSKYIVTHSYEEVRG